MIKSLVRAVEAIPLHLTLAIVRLDDALGESWALPYQACQTLYVLNSTPKRLATILIGNRVFSRFSEKLFLQMADPAQGMSKWVDLSFVL